MGKMVLRQEGTKVTGTYDNGVGEIQGEIRDDTVFFAWKEATGKGGDGFWEIRDQQRALAGKFREGDDGPWTGTWRARKNEEN